MKKLSNVQAEILGELAEGLHIRFLPRCRTALLGGHPQGFTRNVAWQTFVSMERSGLISRSTKKPEIYQITEAGKAALANMSVKERRGEE